MIYNILLGVRVGQIQNKRVMSPFFTQYRGEFVNSAERNKGIIPLPQQQTGYYSEYTLPTPNTTSATNPQRFVSGANGEVYYTPNHYESFVQVRGGKK